MGITLYFHLRKIFFKDWKFCCQYSHLRRNLIINAETILENCITSIDL